MKLLSNKGNSALTGRLLSLNEAFSTSEGLHLFELWAKQLPWVASNNLGCCQEFRLF